MEKKNSFKTSIYLDRDLAKQVKSIAASRDMRPNAAMSEAVSQWAKRESSKSNIHRMLDEILASRNEGIRMNVERFIRLQHEELVRGQQRAKAKKEGES